ncbi:hypothetical protein BX257_4769 [Streptomyces sp. 3212.3]|uniref:hypothetical protein n=1 Tax=Streptomyces sp. 3212.3 TaxID=1938846 RepID=UPI000E263140|nr:hypothetical protein [Streptomyces sp. 3212.3]REE62156.1 hypothetical protein BX257_4769 [Streptomyces sp. 3212.3]
MIVHDAAAAFTAIIDGAVAWVQIFAGAAAITLCALAPLFAPGVKATARRVTGPSWARGRIRARIHARSRIRRTDEPSEPHDFREAA